MTMRKLLTAACLTAIVCGGCAGSAEETGAASQTTPAAAAGEPTTPTEPTAPAAAATAAPAPQATPEPATPAAKPAEPPAPQMPTLAAVVTHKVKDYDAWKKSFDADLDARKSAGIVAQAISRDAANDKIISVWLPATDLTKLKAFLNDKALKDRMKEAGVQGKPQVAIINTVDQKMDPSKKSVQAAMVKLSVKDFAAFKTAFDQGAQARTDAGIIGYSLGQDADDKNVAYLYLPSDDAAKLKAYVDSKDTKKAWKDAGAKGNPSVTLMNEVEMTMYQQ